MKYILDNIEMNGSPYYEGEKMMQWVRITTKIQECSYPNKFTQVDTIPFELDGSKSIDANLALLEEKAKTWISENYK